MKRTRVANVRGMKLPREWYLWPEFGGIVYVGRQNSVVGWAGHQYANPVKLPRGKGSDKLRDDAVRIYSEWIEREIKKNPSIWDKEWKSLQGKTLGCWCHPKLCHAHWLAHIVDYCHGHYHGVVTGPIRMAAAKHAASLCPETAREFISAMICDSPASIRGGDLDGLTFWECRWLADSLAESWGAGNVGAWRSTVANAIHAMSCGK